MVAAMKGRFDQIYSIEYLPELADRASKKFARYPHIRILCGDSRVVMPEILALLKGAALFWLDAGYHGWAGKESDRGRLSAELELILSHPQPHIVLVDDVRALTDRNVIPSVAEVKSYVESKFPQRQVDVQFDILRITRRT